MNLSEEKMRPYLTESELREELGVDGWSKAKIRKAMDPEGGGLIGTLLREGMIEPHGEGWVVVDDVWASSMLLRKGEG